MWFLYQYVIIIVLAPTCAVEWRNFKPNIDLTNLKSKVTLPTGLPHAITDLPKSLPRAIPAGLPAAIGAGLGAGIDALLAEDIDSADVRLLLKDPRKTPETHPILPEAQVSRDEAITIFMTNWDEYYDWASDLSSEYRPVNELRELFSSQNYNSSLSTILILHDRCGNARDSSVLKIMEAFKLRNFDVNYNILVLDFKKLMCKVLATSSLYKLGYNPQLQLLGSGIAAGLNAAMEAGLMTANQTNILALGISSHLAALIAENVHTLSGRMINSILGLDPPVRFLKRSSASLNAEHIHLYHTFTLVPGLTSGLGLATADFVFGGARRRPECNPVRGVCHIMFGVQVFVSTIIYPKSFPTRWCPDFQKFTSHFCDMNDYVYPAFPPDSSAKGVYQVQIGEAFPYGLGSEGIFMAKEQMEPTDDAEKLDGTIDASKLSDQDYSHRLELELTRVRSEMLKCLRGVTSPTVAIQCVLDSQRSVKRMVDQGFINKGDCEPFKMSPTGKVCKYTTRTNNEFKLPF